MAFKYKDRVKNLPSQCLEPGCNGKLCLIKNCSEAICGKCGALHAAMISVGDSEMGNLRYEWRRIPLELTD